MFRIILFNNKLYVFDKSEKEFKQKYGNNFEQISVIKDQDNIDSVCKKLKQQYRAEEIIKDCKIKKKFGWKYFSEDIQERIRNSSRIALKRYIKTKEHNENVSKGRMGKGGRTSPHSEHTKKLMSFIKKQKKINTINNKKWMHDPLTGKEKRGEELEEGMVWGRSPESKDYAKEALRIRALKKNAP